MSQFFQPPGDPINPIYEDGLTNTLARRGRVQTQSTSLVTLHQVDLLPGLFLINPNVTIEIDIFGRFINNVGQKTFTISLDGVTNLLSTGLFTSSNTAYGVNGRIGFDGTNLLWRFRFHTVSFPSTFGAKTDNAAVNNNLLFDPTIAHSLLFQALVANAADTVTIEMLSATIR
jgi:hypothetical protein